MSPIPQSSGNFDTAAEVAEPARELCRCIDWYSEGESRTVEVEGVRISIRFVGRKSRRARISITAPPGAVFTSCERCHCATN